MENIESSSNGSALAVRAPESAALAMVGGPEEAKERLRQLQAFVKEVMVEGVDYGVMPGTKPEKDANGNLLPPKKILLQPGAQKLTEIYGLAIDFEDSGSIEDFDRPLFFYKKRCVLKRKTDSAFAGAGVGSCNSQESKYASRWVYEREVPPHLNKAQLPVREYDSTRGNGTYKKYRVPNEDLFSLVNTIEKMACKRALVMAVIGVTRSAGLFTQDVEDNPEAHGIKDRKPRVEDEEQPWKDEENAAPAAPRPEVEKFEKAFAEAQTDEHVRALAKDINPKRFQRSELAHLRACRVAAEERIAKASATEAPSDEAAPVVEGEVVG